jgi:transcriptional regulator with XRE-family HTH domain
MTKDSGVFLAVGLTSGMESRLARVARGLTQWQVAMKAGVAPWAVSAYERNDRYVPPGWVRKIKAALDLNDG